MQKKTIKDIQGHTISLYEPCILQDETYKLYRIVRTDRDTTTVS
jgi:hypothetical protein